jgi:hypothetical protein
VGECGSGGFGAGLFQGLVGDELGNLGERDFGTWSLTSTLGVRPQTAKEMAEHAVGDDLDRGAQEASFEFFFSE